MLVTPDSIARVAVEAVPLSKESVVVTRLPSALDTAVELPAALLQRRGCQLSVVQSQMGYTYEIVALELAAELLTELLLVLLEVLLLLLDVGGGVELEEVVGGVQTEEEDVVEVRLVVGGVHVLEGFCDVAGGVHLGVVLVGGGGGGGGAYFDVLGAGGGGGGLLSVPPPHDQLVYASPHAAPPVTALHAPGVRSREPKGCRKARSVLSHIIGGK